MADEYMYLGEVPKSVYDKELNNYLERRRKSNAKRVPAQFEYNGKKYTFQKAGQSYQIKHAGERVLKEAKRRVTESKQTVKLSSIEEMMVENLYDEASKRNLAVDHVFPVAKGGPANAPWNLKLMEPSINSAKGAKVGGNWKYEPLIAEGGSIKFKRAAGTALPLAGLAAGVLSAGEAFAAGDAREGTARLLEAGAGEIPIAGDVIQPEAVAGGTFADVERRTAEGLRAKELQQRAAEARQKGGKMSFGLGGVRFTLPELGLSELMGIN